MPFVCLRVGCVPKMNGIADTIFCIAIAVPLSFAFSARAETISLNHSIENHNAIIRATRRNRVSAVSVGVEAEYSGAYLSKLQSGRRWPASRRVYEEPEFYDFTSKITLLPSNEISVTHINDVFMDNHLQETTEIIHRGSLFDTDMHSAMKMRYDSALDETVFETSSAFYGSFADFAYTTRNGQPIAVSVSESFASTVGQVQMLYTPTVQYDMEANDQSFSNIINAEMRFSLFDFALGAKEFYKKRSGSSHTRKLNISYGSTSFGVVSREMEQDLWRNGNTFFVKNKLDFGDGSSDLSVKTSYSLASNSDERKVYVELIWDVSDTLFGRP